MTNLLHRVFETRGERQWLQSLLTATGLHIALLVALFLFALPVGLVDPTVPVDAEWSIPDEVPDRDLERNLPVEIATDERSRDAGGSSAAMASLDPSQPATRAVQDTIASRWARLPTPRPSGGLQFRIEGGFGSDDGLGTGTGDGEGDGSGRGRFFGVGTRGRSFVFVVDCSQSMSAPHESEARTRLGRVKLEMIKSIAAMTPDQRFFVIYFNANPLPMPARLMQHADARNKPVYLDWLSRMKPGGDTNPERALMLAVSLQPEVVFFLTDGIIPRGNKVIRTVTGFNQGRVPIHTFCFAERSGEKLLQVLAERNGGEYHFVP